MKKALMPIDKPYDLGLSSPDFAWDLPMKLVEISQSTSKTVADLNTSGINIGNGLP